MVDLKQIESYNYFCYTNKKGEKHFMNLDIFHLWMEIKKHNNIQFVSMNFEKQQDSMRRLFPVQLHQ